MTISTFGRASRAAALAGCALGVAIFAGCQSKDSEAAAAGAIPGSAYFIGPQPGPDRAMMVAVNPYANDLQVLTQARQLFNQYNCSGCHGDHAGGGMGPSLRDTVWRYGGDDPSIFASISEGRRYGMPAWGSKIPREQIWMLVTYIRSLRTPNEPDPPRR